MACRRCSVCGISYPVSVTECRVCGAIPGWIVDADEDDDWQLAVRLREEGIPSLSESELRRYRRTRWLSFGCDETWADLLADLDIDTHDVERLLKGGCPLLTAIDILL